MQQQQRHMMMENTNSAVMSPDGMSAMGRPHQHSIDGILAGESSANELVPA